MALAEIQSERYGGSGPTRVDVIETTESGPTRIGCICFLFSFHYSFLTRFPLTGGMWSLLTPPSPFHGIEMNTSLYAQ